MERKVLGKISSVSFGLGGYQDAQMALSVSFDLSDGTGVSTTVCGGWCSSVEVTEHTRWTEEERNQQRASLVEKVNELLRQCKIRDVYDLKNKPVEVTIESNTLTDWRILTEVI